MASLRQIRARLKSVQNIQKITRAMEMVSASKLKRAQTRLMAVRAANQYLSDVVQRTAGDIQQMDHPWLRPVPEHPRHLFIVLGSDTGLCGSYNERLTKCAFRWVREQGSDAAFGVVGKRTLRMVKQAGHPVTQEWLSWAGRPDPSRADTIREYVLTQYRNGSADVIQLVYMKFVNSMRYEPTVEHLLPIRVPEAMGEFPPEYIYEPSMVDALEYLLEQWLRLKVWSTLLEAFTSEHSARMMTMRNATDSAGDMLKSLTQQRNKIRQASITRELAEITGTAEALK